MDLSYHYTKLAACVQLGRAGRAPLGAAILALLASLALLGACEGRAGAPAASAPSPDPQPAPITQAPAAPQAQASPQVVAARSASLPARPRRVISLAPSLTEAIFALGAGDRLVGVTRFCDHPPQARQLPRVGGYTDPDLERMIAASAELIVGVVGGQDPALVQRLEQRGLPYAFLKMDDLAQTRQGLLALGELLGEPDAASALVAAMDQGLKPSPRAAKPPRVLLVLGRRPLVVAGPGSFGHELVELAGGHSVAGQLGSPYPSLDLEQLLALDPQVILEVSMGDAAQKPGRALELARAREAAEQAAFWAQHPTLSAVKASRVHLIWDAALLRPGPRLPQALEALRAHITPSQP